MDPKRPKEGTVVQGGTYPGPRHLQRTVDAPPRLPPLGGERQSRVTGGGRPGPTGGPYGVVLGRTEGTGRRTEGPLLLTAGRPRPLGGKNPYREGLSRPGDVYVTPDTNHPGNDF